MGQKDSASPCPKPSKPLHPKTKPKLPIPDHGPLFEAWGFGVSGPEVLGLGSEVRFLGLGWFPPVLTPSAPASP